MVVYPPQERCILRSNIDLLKAQRLSFQVTVASQTECRQSSIAPQMQRLAVVIHVSGAVTHYKKCDWSEVCNNKTWCCCNDHWKLERQVDLLVAMAVVWNGALNRNRKERCKHRRLNYKRNHKERHSRAKVGISFWHFLFTCVLVSVQLCRSTSLQWWT